MKLSRELPTAVDHNNILINYIEVSADDLPDQTQGDRPISQGVVPQQRATDAAVSSGINAQDHEPNAVQEPLSTEKDKDKETPVSVSPVYYGEVYPDYLVDLDCEEQSNRFRRAASGIEEVPPPPSLPLFLGKSILNGTTLMKDDASVLTMPNHTVLNHLSTSSIRNEILATSLTTRYKRKVSKAKSSAEAHTNLHLLVPDNHHLQTNYVRHKLRRCAFCYYGIFFRFYPLV